jgi:cation:H+ antiporter
MDAVMNLMWLGLGLGLLYFGAEWLVGGSSDIALRLGVSPLVVGLTVVAFGTSAPELVVSLQANLDPAIKPDIAVGNIVGSNICNIALLLGLAAVIRPLMLGSQVVKRELPILCGVTVVFVAMLWDGEIERWEGLVLVAGICVYLWLTVRLAKRYPHDVVEAGDAEESLEKARSGGGRRLALDLFKVAVGLAVLVAGANRAILGGVELARLVGVSEAVIGLTLVALGTSLPELATTVVAASRHESDLITGNVVGSNLFNMMLVMGVAASIKPIHVEHIRHSDLFVMLAATFVLVPFFVGRTFRLNRIEGGLLLLGYAGYCVWLFVAK